MKAYSLLPLIPSILASLAFNARAEPVESSDATQGLIEQSNKPLFYSSSSVAGSSAIAKARPKQVKPIKSNMLSSPDSSFLPFFGDEARAAGYELPEPFGVGINYMNMRQRIDVESIFFSGLSLGSFPISSGMFNIGVGHTRERSKTETLRLDAWLLPFMNVYGLIGYTKGSSVSKVGVSVLGMKPSALQNLDFRLDFKGTTYGAGTTFVGGYHNWFSSLDINYTETQFDILDGNINAFTLTPRIGYRFTTPAINTLHFSPGKLNVWVGSMYQDVQQEFKGQLSDLHMPTALLPMINMVNKQGNGRFDVKQHLQSPWNILLGAQYELTRNFNLTTEFGFAQRNSFMLSGEYRF